MISNLLQKNSFFNVLFDIIPLLALIINSEGRIFAINKAAKNFLHTTDEIARFKKAGFVFNCIQTRDDPEACGRLPACKECIVRQTGMAAIRGKHVNRTTAKMELIINGKYKVLNLMVSSAPLECKGEKVAIILLEDITEVIKLKGLIPICASCKKIRNDCGYWSRLETYIESLSEAEFSHDLCPECLEKLYPEYSAKISGREE